MQVSLTSLQDPETPYSVKFTDFGFRDPHVCMTTISFIVSMLKQVPSVSKSIKQPLLNDFLQEIMKLMVDIDPVIVNFQSCRRAHQLRLRKRGWRRQLRLTWYVYDRQTYH